jgi:hypothetical protein
MPAFERLLATQTSIRGLTEAVVFEPTLGRVMAPPASPPAQ